MPVQALWMLLSSLLFATMAVCVKFASAYFNSAELVFYRGVLGIAMLWAYARWRGVALSTPYPAMHAWRSVVGVVSLFGWFYAIAHLPLATAMTLNYMSSVWIAAFLVGGALLLGNNTDTPGSQPGPHPGPMQGPRQGPKQGPIVLAILSSFAGVVMLLRPALEAKQAFAGLVGLLSGMGAALAYMQVMAMARMGEPETRTVFYFAVGTTVAGALGMLLIGTSPWDGLHALWLLPLGLLASLGQLCMTRAYAISTRQGGTLMVANLHYSGIVFSALYGVALFGDRIPAIGWAGMALIVCSAIAATMLRARAAPNAPAQEH